MYKFVKNYEGLASRWTNPYQGFFHRDKENDLFEKIVRSNEGLMECLPLLEDKVLGCWCKCGCHGEVLIKLYNEHVAQKKEE